PDRQPLSSRKQARRERGVGANSPYSSSGGSVQNRAIRRSFFGIGMSLGTAATSVLLGTLTAAADAPVRKTVVAGNYNAGGLHRLVLGADYRKVWATPVSVEVLDLS